jgi:hypothetical protein
MTRFTMTLVPLAFLLGACASAPPSEPASAVDVAQGARPARSDDCNRPTLGQVCVRLVDVNREAPCTCVDSAAVQRLRIWPEPLNAE